MAHYGFSNGLWQTVRLHCQTVEVEAREGTEQTKGQPYVLLQDVEDIFPGAIRLQCGKRSLGFMVDGDGNRLIPLRVRYLPKTTLEVVLRSDLQLPMRIPSQRHVRNAKAIELLLSSCQSSYSSPPSPTVLISPHHESKARFESCQLLHKGTIHSILHTVIPPLHPHAQSHLPIFDEENINLQSSNQHNYSTSIIDAHILSLEASDFPSALPNEELKTQYLKSLSFYESFIRYSDAGRMEQANTAGKDFRWQFDFLRLAMAQHQGLQYRLLQMQQTIKQIQIESIGRLITIQNNAWDILFHYNDVELHENPGPRLFIVLPKSTSLPQNHSSGEGQALRPEDFRLYFLCECGEQTIQACLYNNSNASSDSEGTGSLARPITKSSYSPISGSNKRFAWGSSNLNSNDNLSGGESPYCTSACSASENTITSGQDQSQGGWLSHHIHVAEHEGYDLDNPFGFFQEFGQYTLVLLQVLKYGIVTDECTIPSLATYAGDDSSSSFSSSGAAKMAKDVDGSNLESSVNRAIEFLQSWATKNGSQTYVSGPQQQLAGAHGKRKNMLSKLRSFIILSEKQKSEALGNLYRVPTSEGFTRWICLDHYYNRYNSAAIKELQILAAIDGGAFEEHYGRVTITLTSAVDATQFYKALERTRSILELNLTLDWNISFSEAKVLRDAISHSSIAILRLACTASTAPTEMFSRSKRANPIWQMISNPRLSSFSLQRYSGFFTKVSSPVYMNQLQSLSISDEIEWSNNSSRIIELLSASPHLIELMLATSTKVYETYQAIRLTALKCCPVLERLTIRASKVEKLTTSLEHGQVITDMDVVIPSLGPYSSLFESGSPIRYLHITSRTSFQGDGELLLKLICRSNTLTDLRVCCYVSEFHSFYTTVRRGVTENIMDTKGLSTSLKRVCLYRGSNQLYTADIMDPEAVCLELLQINVYKGPMLHLIQRYGSKLTKLKIDGPQWMAAHSTALLESVSQILPSSLSSSPTLSSSSSASSSSPSPSSSLLLSLSTPTPALSLFPLNSPLRPRLEELFLTVLNVDESILEDLSAVINQSEQLRVFKLLVDQPFKEDIHRSMCWIEFMKKTVEKLTTLILSCKDPKDWMDAFETTFSSVSPCTRFRALENILFAQPPRSKLDRTLTVLLDEQYTWSLEKYKK